jgi:hypothetical protein
MAYDERRRGTRRGERTGSAPEWRGDDGFGGGWGNQVPRPHRPGGPLYRDPGDESGDGPYYGGGGARGHGGDWYGPAAADSDYLYGGPGLDSEFGAPRFDRAEIGGASRRGGHRIAPASGYGMRAFAFGREAQRDDPHYDEWRERRMAEFDRDYDEYRRENQSRFDREFGEWRQRRGAQRAALGQVREHMEVIGSDGGHVGIVDCTRGDRVILTRSDEAPGGVHHVIPCAWVDRVDDKVVLNLDAEEARRRWQSENRSRALFEREHLGVPGPHVLNRSFAGTYSDEE